MEKAGQKALHEHMHENNRGHVTFCQEKTLSLMMYSKFYMPGYCDGTAAVQLVLSKALIRASFVKTKMLLYNSGGYYGE